MQLVYQVQNISVTIITIQTCLKQKNWLVKILDRALEAHELRKGMPVFIPPYEITAEVGFSPESTVKHYGSFKPLAEALKSGKVSVVS